jgi:hypothetical protein
MKSSSTKLVSAKAIADQRLNQRPLLPKFKTKEGWRAGLSFGIVSKPRQMYLETKVRVDPISMWEWAKGAKKQRIDPTSILSIIFPLIFFVVSISPNLIELLGSVNRNLM